MKQFVKYALVACGSGLLVRTYWLYITASLIEATGEKIYPENPSLLGTVMFSEEVENKAVRKALNKFSSIFSRKRAK